jgi:hypothetical protein
MSICGHDLDDVFAYSTPKVVVVRDRWLGLLKLFFMLAIFVFVVVSVCLASPPRYVKLAEPIGSIGYIGLKRVQQKCHSLPADSTLVTLPCPPIPSPFLFQTASPIRAPF